LITIFATADGAAGNRVRRLDILPDLKSLQVDGVE
jgi:hypothetical protein